MAFSVRTVTYNQPGGNLDTEGCCGTYVTPLEGLILPTWLLSMVRVLSAQQPAALRGAGLLEVDPAVVNLFHKTTSMKTRSMWKQMGTSSCSLLRRAEAVLEAERGSWLRDERLSNHVRVLCCVFQPYSVLFWCVPGNFSFSQFTLLKKHQERKAAIHRFGRKRAWLLYMHLHYTCARGTPRGPRGLLRHTCQSKLTSYWSRGSLRDLREATPILAIKEGRNSSQMK